MPLQNASCVDHNSALDNVSCEVTLKAGVSFSDIYVSGSGFWKMILQVLQQWRVCWEAEIRKRLVVETSDTAVRRE